ncbi:non-hydrolyzing UDP-N-acetylglucosamine 2-epimerase [Sanguibacter inulinus]|uniref:non-hydrolyzing UDP-N-acetylglucosamine 2-epimerase n=1 Tax=Sanguibacter inulinus TaxID=60922 RepID=UPI00280608E1|nr:UDP-N-acetylglucosamine 2-epimerase (non-hydrolyzing) [Sanguibacter inulinus]
MRDRLKVVTIVGTRPEIIRLARVIAALEEHTEHVLVHTGQNYDYELNEVFFEDLDLRRPDHFLNADTSSLGAVLGDILKYTEKVLREEQPDAVVVLGDTNSCIAALMARRMKIPVYHLEAGNRSFDPNIPEEINRHLVDHVADYNLVYSEHSRRNLLAEGLHPSRIMHIGSPMNEVLGHYRGQIDSSDAVERLGLKPQKYFLASLHREENVDDAERLAAAIEALSAVATHYEHPVLLSTHPRTQKRIDLLGITEVAGVIFHRPLGFHDYNALQLSARCVLSDSGTISEESTMLGFPAVTLRDAIERPEAIDTGAIVLAGVRRQSILSAIHVTLEQWSTQGRPALPADYQVVDSARRTVNFILSTAPTHQTRAGIRRTEG